MNGPGRERDDTPPADQAGADVTPGEWRAAAMRRLGVEGTGRWSGVNRSLVAVAALAAGIMFGRWFENIAPMLWLTGAGAAIVTALLAGWWQRPALRGAALTAGVVLLGGARTIDQQTLLAPDDLAARLGDEPMLVTLRGVARTPPEHRARTAGSMARFDFRKPATYFQLDVEAAIDDDGEAQPVSGQVLVRVDEPMPPFRAGDQVTLTGRIAPFRNPVNPGEFNYARHARALQQAGMVIVPDRRLVEVTPRQRLALVERVTTWREAVRRKASGWLLADLPGDPDVAADADRAALLSALLLGERERQYEEIDETFRRVGLAHLLAISGLHLGILIGLVLMLARLGSGVRARHGWMIIAAVLIYLLIVEVRLPLTRAAIMTMAGALGLALGRPMRISGLIALSAAGILLWRPDQLFSAGFQLSFGVVLALAYLAPRARVRWFGVPNAEASTVGEMVGEWLKTTTAAATVAWCVATPVVMHHFGVVSPLAIVLSVVLLPVVAVLLTLGFTKLITAPILPSIAMIVGVPLTTLADMTLSLVRAADAMPLSSINVPPPGAVWSIACAAMVTLWLRFGWRRRRFIQFAGVAVAAWLITPMVIPFSTHAMRIDMLSVGDGTCIVVRSGGETVVFDAGSSTNLNAGDASILPALRAIGVRRVDAVAISHANLDHYSAVLEVVDAFGVPQVLITQHTLDAARDGPLGSLAYLLDQLTQRRINLRLVHAGDVLQFGEATWTWLHPTREASFGIVNDTSMVVRVEVPTDAGLRSLLLTGDVQVEAIATVLDRHKDLQADIIEMPHHGSYNEAAEALLEQVAPSVLLQSTGWRRLENDAWRAVLDGRVARLITARDGACSVTIGRDGSIETSTFKSR